MSSILKQDPVYVGRLQNAPLHALGDRVIKAVFLVPEHERFDPGLRHDELLAALQQVRAREVLLHDYYTGFARIDASGEELARWPILLKPRRRFWVLGAAEFYPLKHSPAGNWNDGHAVTLAKGALGAQIYRLEALLLGATHNNGQVTAVRSDSIRGFCRSLIKPRLEHTLREVGSRGEGGDWLHYIKELLQEYGGPTVRRLYCEPSGSRSRLAIGTQWRREGRQLAGSLPKLDKLTAAEPALASEIRMLQYAADILARATIAARDGVAQANRQDELSDDARDAIVDIYSEPDLGTATEAALRWNLNSADNFQSLGAFRGFLDAACALGIHNRTGKVELPGLASFGIRAMMRINAEQFFEPLFTDILDRVRQRLPVDLIEAAEQASRDIPNRLDLLGENEG